MHDVVDTFSYPAYSVDIFMICQMDRVDYLT